MNSGISEEMIHKIVDALGENIVRIILYGSMARGSDTPESDIDIAVIVKHKPTLEEYNRLLDANVDLDLTYDRAFSVIDIEIEKLQQWGNISPFYINLQKDGVVLCEVA